MNLPAILDAFRAVLCTLQNNAAIFISLSALFLTIYQALATRTHNRLSVKPYLTTFVERQYSKNGQVTVVVALRNQGSGPALIKDFELIVGGTTFKPSTPNEIANKVKSALTISLIEDKCYYTVLSKGYALGKGDTVALASVVIQMFLENTHPQLEDALEAFHVRISYQSIYNEPFLYDSQEHRSTVPTSS